MTEYFLGQGLLGVCVVVLAAVIVSLQRRNDKLREQIDALNELRLKDRDLRLEDQRANGRVILETVDSFKAATYAVRDELKETRETVERLHPQRSGYR